VIGSPAPWPNGARCAVALTFDRDAESLLHIYVSDTAHSWRPLQGRDRLRASSGLGAGAGAEVRDHDGVDPGRRDDVLDVDPPVWAAQVLAGGAVDRAGEIGIDDVGVPVVQGPEVVEDLEVVLRQIAPVAQGVAAGVERPIAEARPLPGRPPGRRRPVVRNADDDRVGARRRPRDPAGSAATGTARKLGTPSRIVGISTPVMRLRRETNRSLTALPRSPAG
jgi:hypothetical protein